MKQPIVYCFAFAAATFMFSCQNNSTDKTTAETTPIETVSNTASSEQVYHVVPSASKIHWEGYKPAMGTTHTGTVNISEGQFGVEDGMIKSGSFVIDFRTITDTDLEGEQKAKLENHLKGTVAGKEDDFFNVDKYPTGKFEITKTSALTGEENANMLVYGNLTIKDVTQNVGFKAQVDMKNGSIHATTPLFKIDRTNYDIKVLSNKFFENLKDNFVADEFGIRIELRADRGQDI